MNKFEVGDKVWKPLGYEFSGEIIGVFKKLDGQIRYAVESTSDGSRGVVHIFRASQLKAVEQ